MTPATQDLRNGIYQPKPPCAEQISAVKRFAAAHGRWWKHELRYCWETGRYSTSGVPSEDVPWLQALRNVQGPKWLTRFNVRNAKKGRIDDPSNGLRSARSARARQARRTVVPRREANRYIQISWPQYRRHGPGRTARRDFILGFKRRLRKNGENSRRLIVNRHERPPRLGLYRSPARIDCPRGGAPGPRTVLPQIKQRW